MSAAEKLKALEKREDDSALWFALPQIVAVVEAAETNLVIYDAALIAAGMNTTPNTMLFSALTALEDALS